MRIRGIYRAAAVLMCGAAVRTLATPASDQKAAEVLAAARKAIGGNTIDALQALSARALPRRAPAAESQIRSIRFSRDMFAAENHGGGLVFVDIVTQPGMGPLRGNVELSYRDDGLNARNAFQPTKGPEQTQQYTVNLTGTLVKEGTSFSLSATGASFRRSSASRSLQCRRGRSTSA